MARRAVGEGPGGVVCRAARDDVMRKVGEARERIIAPRRAPYPGTGRRCPDTPAHRGTAAERCRRGEFRKRSMHPTQREASLAEAGKLNVTPNVANYLNRPKIAFQLRIETTTYTMTPPQAI